MNCPASVSILRQRAAGPVDGGEIVIGNKNDGEGKRVRHRKRTNHHMNHSFGSENGNGNGGASRLPTRLDSKDDTEDG